MANRVIDRSFFTNTYITGSGRQNYLRIDNLEDPLFTSFTLDIDFVTSPLFYTINGDYGYPKVEGMGDRIEAALESMYKEKISTDDGYDILPVLSAGILDGNKMGFGLQQNVFMDRPLYGATEYIYMVDKRNGSADQNDVIHDSNLFGEFNNPNWMNSYKLGSNVKSIVNESDKKWAEKNKENNDKQIVECDKIMEDTLNTHQENETNLQALREQCESIKGKVEGIDKEYTEEELQQEVDRCEKDKNAFEQLKKDISDWVNSEISQYQNKGTNIYSSNKCIQKIATYSDITFCDSDKIDNTYKPELEKLYGADFVNVHISGGDESYLNKFDKLYDDMKKNLLDFDGERADIKQELLINKFGDRLATFELYKKGDKSISGKVQAITGLKDHPDWLNKVSAGIPAFVNEKEKIKMSKDLMSLQCDDDISFVGFDSEKISNSDNELSKYQRALENFRTELYGFENNAVCEKSNPAPNSLYAQYLEAKNKCENDDYSQAERNKIAAQSGSTTMNHMLSVYNQKQKLSDAEYEVSVSYVKDPQPVLVNRKKSIVASQTVLDMLGFISGMKKMTLDYPYIIQGITGLDTAYNKHYGIKDPYLGSGDDKITLTCLESLDLRVSSMFNRYFNAVYDRQYRRERVPVNLRRFNCFIYVHDVRNFVSNIRRNSDGVISSYNRILELTDMYYSVIEFRFYDCEIVPEETGNIFNDISNEAPSEMKKTNFTFTYGNCVVNFVPASEVAEHNSKQNTQG